jgi:hypothetical protein
MLKRATDCVTGIIKQRAVFVFKKLGTTDSTVIMMREAKQLSKVSLTRFHGFRPVFGHPTTTNYRTPAVLSATTGTTALVSSISAASFSASASLGLTPPTVSVDGDPHADSSKAKIKYRIETLCPRATQ